MYSFKMEKKVPEKPIKKARYRSRGSRRPTEPSKARGRLLDLGWSFGQQNKMTRVITLVGTRVITLVGKSK